MNSVENYFEIVFSSKGINFKLSKFPNIKVCDDENKIGPMLREFNNNKLKISKQHIDKFRNIVLYSDKLSFGGRLYDAINKIIK